MKNVISIKIISRCFSLLFLVFVSSIVFCQVPTKVVVTTQPVIGYGHGALMSVQPVVEIRDASNLKVAASNAQVRISISSGTGGSIGGTTVINAVNGVATFTNLTFTGVRSQSYVFQFSSDPLIAYEPFAYGAGTLTGNNGGSGFSAAWYGPNGAFTDLAVNTTGFTYTNFTTSGGRATYTSSTGGDGARQLSATSNAIYSTVWLAFLANYDLQGGGFNNLRLYLPGGLSGAVGGNAGVSNWSILDNNLTATTFSTVPLDGTLHLALLKIDYTAGTSALWIDPVVASFDGTQTPSHTQNFAPVFDRIELYNRMSGIGSDEITVASTYKAALHLEQNLTADISAASTLPVTWKYFTAICARNSTLLKWGTTDEKNNNYFAVERKDDNSQWMTVGNIQGAGTSGSGKNYEFYDTSSATKNYYRLRQVDDDGNATYSKIVTASCTVARTENFRVYPNPVSNVIKLSGFVSGSKYQLINTSGHLVRSGHVGGDVTDIYVSGLPRGNYFLQVVGYPSQKIQIIESAR
jgi:hypothetical protein